MWMLNFEPMPSMRPHPVFTCPSFLTSTGLQMSLVHKTIPVSGMVPWDQEIQPSLRWQQGLMTASSPCLKKFFFWFPILSFLSENHLRRSSVYIILQSPHPTSWKVRNAQGWNKSVRGFSSCETHLDGGRGCGRGHVQDTASPGCFHLCRKIETTLQQVQNISKYHCHYFEANQQNFKGTK